MHLCTYAQIASPRPGGGDGAQRNWIRRPRQGSAVLDHIPFLLFLAILQFHWLCGSAPPHWFTPGTFLIWLL